MGYDCVGGVSTVRFDAARLIRDSNVAFSGLDVALGLLRRGDDMILYDLFVSGLGGRVIGNASPSFLSIVLATKERNKIT